VSTASFDALREECCHFNGLLPKLGLAEMTFGNVSIVDRKAGVFAIKPSGVAYDELIPQCIVILDMEGKVVEGKLRPSSDTPTHRRLFQAFLQIRSVVHTHSRNAAAFAQAGMGIPCLGTTHADYFHGEVPVTRPMIPKEIRGSYEWETGNVIAERFRALGPQEVPAVLVHGHGAFTWGGSAKEAVENAQALEMVAEMARTTLQLNPKVTPLSSALMDKHFRRKHGPTAYYGQGR
jgi:L-ribulose-5-phosphate 4-epimerase